MTFWADNIKFIKDIQESKYKKIDDAIHELNEHIAKLSEGGDNKKHRELFIESARAMELMDVKELHALAETMFKDMPESEKHKEEEKLKEYEKKYQDIIAKIKEARKAHNIK